MASMKVLVAGGSGFLGRHATAALRSRGHEVWTLDRGRRVRPEGVTSVRVDLTSDTIPREALNGAGAIVNLVGIKRSDGAQTFEAAHVGVTRTLLGAAQDAGIRRFVHISVVCRRPDPMQPYHDTKWRAEELVRASGLDATVLRPGVVYGRGDDMLSHLAAMIRCAPVFPIVGRGTSPLQPVHVGDVAEAIVRALESPHTIGRGYDVVGPRPHTLRDVVGTVARALRRSVWIVPTPVAILRPAVACWSGLSARAFSTPAQLKMLEEGLVGDPEPARADLGLEPRAFDEAAVRESLAPESRPRGDLRGAWTVIGTAVASSFAAAALVPNPWYRMAALGAVLAAASFALVPLPWRDLLRPTLRSAGLGAAAAVAMYTGGAAAFLALTRAEFAPQIEALYAWRALVPRAAVLPLLAFIVLTEEIVWRNAVTWPLVARFGTWNGTVLAALAFAAAHVAMGVPVLVLAAFGAGLFWSLMVVHTRSAVPAFLSHLSWDVAVLLLWPYPDVLR